MGLAYENISASGPNAGEFILYRSHCEVIRLHFPFHPSVASLLTKEVPSPDDRPRDTIHEVNGILYFFRMATHSRSCLVILAVNTGMGHVTPPERCILDDRHQNNAKRLLEYFKDTYVHEPPVDSH